MLTPLFLVLPLAALSTLNGVHARVSDAELKNLIMKRWTRQATSQLSSGPIFSALDTDRDGKLSYSELVSAQIHHWGSQEKARRGFKTLGLHSLEESFHEFDTDRKHTVC